MSKKITSLNRQLEEVFRQNNMPGVADFYLDSAIISGARTNITGRANIDDFLDSLIDKKAIWKLEIDGIEDYGAIVIQRERSYLAQPSEGGTVRSSNVKFLLVWKKVGSAYKILYDNYSSL